jgi:hypothetical protein
VVEQRVSIVAFAATSGVETTCRRHQLEYGRDGISRRCVAALSVCSASLGSLADWNATRRSVGSGLGAPDSREDEPVGRLTNESLPNSPLEPALAAARATVGVLQIAAARAAQRPELGIRQCPVVQPRRRAIMK